MSEDRLDCLVKIFLYLEKVGTFFAMPKECPRLFEI